MVAQGTGLRWFFATMVSGKRNPRKMREQFGETRGVFPVETHGPGARVARDGRGVPGTFLSHKQNISALCGSHSLSSVMMSELEKLG